MNEYLVILIVAAYAICLHMVGFMPIYNKTETIFDVTIKYRVGSEEKTEKAKLPKIPKVGDMISIHLGFTTLKVTALTYSVGVTDTCTIIVNAEPINFLKP